MSHSEDLHRGSTIFRTLRIKTANRVGVLARVLTVVAEHGASLGDIRTVSIAPLSRIRDMDMGFTAAAEIDRTVAAINGTGEAEVLEVRDEVLELHVGGKLVVESRYPIRSESDLGRVYTPGVGEVSRRIAADPSLASHYTIKSNTVAIVSDGTAVLGLGNIGPLAALPVLEGKAALLSQLAGVYGIPIVTSTSDPHRIVDAVETIAPTFGLIQLEDIAAPACFGVEETLSGRGVPVFHDDQHGTAAVVLAALINATEMVDRDLRGCAIGCVGLGAAGNAVTKALMRYTGNPVRGADLDPAAVGRVVAAGGIASTLAEIMATCDVVVAVTGKRGLIAPEMVRPGQIIFALSNPYPEIEVSVALERGATLATDGRSTNNLLAFPGLCRGGLDAGVRRFDPAIFAAAAEAIVSMTPRGHVLPSPLDPAVHRMVARGVAMAAVTAGVASRHVDEDYMLTGR
ncbi:MAG: NAD-dependent malic enzyme [Chloroflexi bacterium]|nr:NAD-dependent malic enzyme [Chloroflexota bacterium]